MYLFMIVKNGCYVDICISTACQSCVSLVTITRCLSWGWDFFLGWCSSGQVWTGLQWLPPDVSSRWEKRVGAQVWCSWGWGWVEASRCPGQVSSVGERVGAQVWCPGGGGGLGTLPCNLSHDACDVPNPFPPGQTDACENINLSKLRFRTVII